MTKEELQRRIVEEQRMLETILPLSDGQECLIYKAKEFSVSDEIIYIPDVWENDLNTFDRSEDDVKIYAERVIESCYSGRDFVAECGGDVELAERLFHYCDWQHPSSALPEVDDRETDEITVTVKDHQAKGQGCATMDTEEMRGQLIDRVRDNFAGYRAELLLKDRQELIDGADRIAKTAEVFQYFTEHRLTEPEMAYFLKFQNPLEVASDHWNSSTFELDALGAVISDAVDRQDDLTLYPLAVDIPVEKASGLRKFMNVDMDKVLPQIMAQKTAFYQTDLNYTIDELRRGIATEDPAKRNFVVIFRQSGVDCLNERDMFIAGTRSYNACQYYHSQTREPVLAYSVELLGNGANGLRGNLYQQDQHQMAQFAERAASPYTDVTVTFFDGREVRIPEKEYNYETIPNLKYRYGDILDTRNEAEDESVVQGATKREHERRERMPQGHIAVHVQKLEESRIQTEADRLASALQSLTEPNTPDKTHFMVEVSPYFVPLASDDDMYRLFVKVQEQVKQPMYIGPEQTVGNREGQFFFMRREERTQEQSKKPSIKEQLAVKPVPGDKPAAKSKDREAR